MEDKHDIACHSFIGDDDLLTTVDDEVATLVKSALLSVVGDFVGTEVFQVTELGPNHHRYLTKIYLFRLRLPNHLPLGCLRLSDCPEASRLVASSTSLLLVLLDCDHDIYLS